MHQLVLILLAFRYSRNLKKSIENQCFKNSVKYLESFKMMNQEKLTCSSSDLGSMSYFSRICGKNLKKDQNLIKQY